MAKDYSKDYSTEQKTIHLKLFWPKSLVLISKPSNIWD